MFTMQMDQFRVLLKKMQIDKTKYNSMIKDIKITNIFLKKMNLENVEFPKEDKTAYSVELNYGCNDFMLSQSSIEFYPEFHINVESENNNMVSLSFTMRAIYELEGIEKYEDEYIKEFINRNLPLNIWPYAREIISSITTRIGYPTLVIDPYRG
jgi:preprotein translocase subunit SecB